MNARMLMALGLGAVVAVGLALMFVDRPDESPATDADDQALVSGLADRVNTVDAVDVIGSDGQTVATLRRERERWRMREEHDYEADFARVHDLLRDLARAERLEAKTANPEWYGRLGVAEPGTGDGAGLMLRFPDTDLPWVIVGERDSAGIGRYVRIEDEDRAWLTGADLDVPGQRMEWLQRAVMGIPAADIQEVSVRHPDSDKVELRPADEGGEVWVMLDPPAEREVKPEWQLRQTASALAALNMEDVRPHESHPVPDDAVESVYLTRDGMRFTARTWADEEGNWVHFRVSEAEALEASPSSEAGEQAPDGQATERELDVVAVDGRLSPWQFAISDERFEYFRPKTEDLLMAPEESED